MGVVTREMEITSPLPQPSYSRPLLLILTPFSPRPSPTRSRPSSSSKAMAASEVSRRLGLNYLKHRVDELDQDNLSYAYTVFEGEILKNIYERIRFETKFVAVPSGGTILR
ncbi:hypothetical protein GQ457_01G030190 [Hibiscus cannabinus]